MALIVQYLLILILDLLIVLCFVSYDVFCGDGVSLVYVLFKLSYFISRDHFHCRRNIVGRRKRFCKDLGRRHVR